MAEMEVSGHPKRMHVRQPPAVPFLWEQKPGLCKKYWQPGVPSVSPIITPPVKLIASVPFDWEEKPRTPLSCFSQPMILPTETEKLLALPPPPAYAQGYYGVDYDNDDSDDKRNGSFDFNADDSFSSAPSVLANCLAPSVATRRSFSSYEPEEEIHSSPASEADSSSSTSRYAGTSSLVGASFLECLFPLLLPKSSFLVKTGCSKRKPVTPQEVNYKDFDGEGNCTVITRRPTTLGELIMMSRKRSCTREKLFK